MKPITLKLAQMGCAWVSPGGGRESGAPMPCLLPSLKLECEKLASEKTEMQRHYVMVRGLACQVGAGVGNKARGVNPDSLCRSGVHPCPSQGLVFPVCRVGWLGLWAVSPGTLTALKNSKTRMPPVLMGISEGSASLGTTCPTSLERVEGALLPSRGSHGSG